MNLPRIVAATLVVVPIIATADMLTLKGAKAPDGPNQWEEPAEISYLNNSGGDSSYAINAALSGILPNIPGTTMQPQISAWIAKNTLLKKKQDKRGLDASFGFVGGDEHFGYFPQFILSIDRDNVIHSDERTVEATIDFVSKDLKLGGCGKAVAHGCTYWDFMVGLYSNNVHSSDDNSGIGTINGGTAVVKVTSNPFPMGHAMAPLSFSLLTQGQWDASASGDRTKENRTLYKGVISWRFYQEGDKVKPSIALVRTVGADLLAGQPKQANTKVSFRVEF